MVFILRRIFQQKMSGRFVLVHRKHLSALSLPHVEAGISQEMARVTTSLQTENATGVSMAQREH